MQQEAHFEIEKWKNESIERLKTEIDDQKKSWQQSLEDEKEAFLQKLKIAISQQVFQVARKAFNDLASEQLELRLIDTFLEKIDTEIDSAFQQDRDQKTVRIISGFPLQQIEKDRLQKGLSPFFSRNEQFHFEEDAGIGFGLRLLSGNHKWEWNLTRYMLDFEDEILKTMGMTK
jgi:F0F1-type ATP synthase delta subunit